MADTQKLNFEVAMNDFKIMFPHLNTDVIEKVLRSNNGMVDQTIDDLLALSCEDTEPSTSSLVTDPHFGNSASSSSSSSHNNNNQVLMRPIYELAASSSSQQQSRANFYPTLSYYLPPGDLTLTPRANQPAIQKYGQVPVNVLGVQFNIPYVYPLPDKFLRLSDPIPARPLKPGLQYQLEKDREFALLLHNEEFLQQAQVNEEFMKTLNQDSNGIPKRGPSEDVSISQKLAATGKVTRDKLLKIAKKLNIKRSMSFSKRQDSGSSVGVSIEQHGQKASSGSKLRQPLLEESTCESYEPLLSDRGDTSLIIREDVHADFNDGDDYEEFKTIPRDKTIAGFSLSQQRAKEVLENEFHSRVPPIPPPMPPPGPDPSSLSRCSTLSYTSDYHTLENLPSALHPKLSNQYAKTGNLLDISLNDANTSGNTLENTSDDMYDDQEITDPIYEDPGEFYKPVSSSLNTKTESQSELGQDDLVIREIHSDSLSSSYFIPINPVSDETYDNRDSEAIYDNIADHRLTDSKLIQL